MADPKETLLDWLRDAHAMEDSLVGLLEKQAKAFEGHPTMSGKINEHVEVTRTQRDRVKGLIETLGGSTSKTKTIAGNVFANLQAMAGAAAPDAIVKNSLANYAIEHFEIACYTSLIAAAEAQGQNEVKRVCQEILDEERDMASWLQHNVPRVTTEYLGKKETAKR